MFAHAKRFLLENLTPAERELLHEHTPLSRHLQTATLVQMCKTSTITQPTSSATYQPKRWEPSMKHFGYHWRYPVTHKNLCLAFYTAPCVLHLKTNRKQNPVRCMFEYKQPHLKTAPHSQAFCNFNQGRVFGSQQCLWCLLKFQSEYFPFAIWNASSCQTWYEA